MNRLCISQNDRYDICIDTKWSIFDWKWMILVIITHLQTCHGWVWHTFNFCDSLEMCCVSTFTNDRFTEYLLISAQNKSKLYFLAAPFQIYSRTVNWQNSHRRSLHVWRSINSKNVNRLLYMHCFENRCFRNDIYRIPVHSPNKMVDKK